MKVTGKSSFKKALAIIVGATALMASGNISAAAEFPSKPIEVVTHASAGGGTDTTARMMLIRARRTLKADAFVSMKRGGSGAVAMSYFKEKPADGHTLLAITPTHIFTIARGGAPMDLDEVVGLVRATDDPLALMVKSDSKLKSFKDFIGAAKSGGVTVGGTHVGGVDHVAVLSLAKAAGIKVKYVPFDGGGKVLTNLMGGNIDVGLFNVTEAQEQLKAGDMRALVVLSEQRLPSLPDSPTAKENGMDVVFSTVRGYLVHKDTPADRRAYLEEKLLKALKHDTFQGYLKNSGLDESSVAGSKVWDAQIRKMLKVAKTTLAELGMVKKK